MGIGAPLSYRVAVETGLSLTGLCWFGTLWRQLNPQARCLRTQRLRKEIILKPLLAGWGAGEGWLVVAMTGQLVRGGGEGREEK